MVELRTQNTGLRGELDVVRGVATETEENDAMVIRDLTGKLSRLRDDLAHAEENVRHRSGPWPRAALSRVVCSALPCVHV